ncbi:hypothetical protein [Yeosuana marina]|uniref:hypothetical protein n=1 Tax=Yeosuana marina TaxID=1565536 RepID=UPI0014225233|nr:hypothetical protein [Yeosuana marina]
MTRHSRRHSTGFGYIGFGNNQNIFNQHSKKPFSELKERLDQETHLNHQLNFVHHKLSKGEKEDIKNKIRKAEKVKAIKIFVVTFILTILLAIAIYFYLFIPLFKAFK